ncbi:hypothetical protein [Chelativorans salis]|uniref:Uncharacterized protein n=1 Tax=Chelativorans salis TaxID=2978478 RepID=A0ABT2LN87_9HYPH|nr:hypothetical protein [Chelativorans sp. EGI FJ00035]MCT7374644.1 hypothetical protein [Chelativorans sp. EGI FJ00035]
MRAFLDSRLSPPDEAGRPHAGGEAQRAAARGGIVFSLISLALAVLMAVTLYYILQSVRELSALESRLSELNQFERRLSGKIDKVNEGVQAQIDRLASNVSGLSGEVGRLQVEVQEVRRKLQALTEELENGAAFSSVVLPEAEDEPSRSTTISAPPPPRAEDRSAASSRPGGSWRFERIETPDGKVTYSRVR